MEVQTLRICKPRPLSDAHHDPPADRGDSEAVVPVGDGRGDDLAGAASLAAHREFREGSLLDMVAHQLNPLADAEPSQLDGDPNVMQIVAAADLKKKRGLSPYMLLKNQTMQNAKRLKGGSKLTPSEIQQVTLHAKATMHTLEESGVQRELYDNWRAESQDLQLAAANVAKPLKTAWGGGCKACPVSASELVQYHNLNGWPSDNEVYHEQKHSPAPTTTIEFGSFSSYNLFGCSQSGKGCCLSKFGRDPRCALLHDSLCNYLEVKGKAVAESGEVMIMLEGELANPPGKMCRRVGLITNVIWSPRCFDMIVFEFEKEECIGQDELELPAFCKIKTRTCKVSDHYTVAATLCSGDLVLELAAAFQKLSLFTVKEDVADRDDSLRWSKISACQLEGIICSPELRTPLFEEDRKRQAAALRAENKAARLLKTDPMSSTGRGPGRGGRRRPASSGRGRGCSEFATASHSAEAPLRATSGRDADNDSGGGGAHDMHGSHAFAGSSGDGGHARPMPGSDLDGGDGHGVGPGIHDEFDWDIVDGLEAELVGLPEGDAAEIGEAFRDGLHAEGEGGLRGPAVVVVDDAGQLDESLRRESDLAGLPGEEEEPPLPPPAGLPPLGEEGQAPSPPQPPPPPISLQDLHRLVGPTNKGWWSQDGEPILQIMRGNPKGNLVIQCKQHAGCRMIMPLKKDPGNEVIFKWLFELPPSWDKPLLESEEIGKAHVKLARSFRYGGPTGPTAGVSASGAGSSAGD